MSLIGFKSFLVENDESVAVAGMKKSLVDLYAASTNGLDALNGDEFTSLSAEVLDNMLMLGDGVKQEAGDVKAAGPALPGIRRSDEVLS